MSTLLDETAADVPVRDITVTLSRLQAGPQDASQSARARQDVSRVSREELEDRFLRLHEDTLLLKQHIHKQDDKIKKLGTKLMRLVKDRGRMEQLAAGGAQPRVRDVEMEEMMEELQEKVRGLQTENEGLKQRLLVAKQQLLNSQGRRPSPYGHVQPRVKSGPRRPRDESPSPSRPKSTRSLEGGGRPPAGQLPRYGHSLLEEARAEIRNLENVVESQRGHVEELEGAAELLREELSRKEAQYEERLLQVRQQQTSRLRSHVNDNVTMIKLQKQLADRSNAVAELEGRFLQLQESQRALKSGHDAAMLKVDELSAQLRDERLRSLDLETRLQTCAVSRSAAEQLQEQVAELEQERDLLKENNQKLVSSALDVSQQQKRQIQEQQLRLQVAQLEAALKADLVDKNQILDQVKAERDRNEKLDEEKQKLQIQVLEQKQQMEELSERLRVYGRENEYDVAELTEALLLIKSRKSRRSGELGFLKEVEEEAGGSVSVSELRAAHAETIQELEKTRNLLSTETRISQNYKAELEAVLQKAEGERAERERRLERQAQLLDSRAEKIKRLEAQLRDVAYGTRPHVLRPDSAEEDGADGSDEAFHPERGENLVELQIVGAALSPSVLEELGDEEPSTFCTYSFYLFELHATPVATGRRPRYGFTSRYAVSADERFLDYLGGGSVAVEMHQALGLDWRTLGTARLRLRPLLERDGKVHGTAALVASGPGDEVRSVGSVDFWVRLRVPMTETLRLYAERAKAGGGGAGPRGDAQAGAGPNQLSVAVQRCRQLRTGTSRQPSPYVVYRFFGFPDHPTATVHDSRDPRFDDVRSYSVPMDAGLGRYLRSEELQFYVFDYKEERMDAYLGKARVPLRPLARDEAVSGAFELTDPSGLAAGHIEVTLRWRFSYRPPSVEREPEEPRREREDEGEEEEEARRSSSPPDGAASEVAELRRTTRAKDGARKVTFVDPTGPDEQVGEQDPRRNRTHGTSERSASQADDPNPPGPGAPADGTEAAPPPEEEDDEDESHVSEGQLVPASPGSCSDGSEETTTDGEEAPASERDRRGSTQSDSDDCIVQGAAAARKASDRVRVEIVALSLSPESRAGRDASVVRLFVEYSFLDLPTEETPLSLPKPPPGNSVNYNYSKVVPVDAENNGPRRRLLRDVLRGRNPAMERIRFTVVSEPPEEEEQDRECEDVGVAFIRIPDILERERDLTETSLRVVAVEDSSEVVGTLTVSVEGLEALRAIMEDQDQD